jgi:hypothetical protein
MRASFVIRDTRKYGKGVFAVRQIPKGTVIHAFGGETVSVRDLVDRVNAGKENIDDPLQVGLRTYIDLDELSRTFNHSCEPNAALRKRSELFALRDIPKGEEITYDYSLTIAPTQWRMKCVCGTRSCRKILGDVLSVPESVRARHRKLGAVQDYMKRLLDSVERDGTYIMPAFETSLLKVLKKTSNV